MKLSTIAALTTAIATATVSTIAIAPAANAGTLITNTAGQVTDIEDLEILGYGTYDVTFHSGSYNDVFGSMDPTFSGDEAGAIAAAEAIAALLGDTFAIAESSSRIPSDSFQISYSDNSSVIDRNSFELDIDTIVTTGIPGRNAIFGIGAGTIRSVFPWAKFTLSDSSDPTPVPEPTALLGLGLALGLSTLTRRRNQNQ
ncbi:MAG: PEP-CTERM sorting domain-containing protein [Cyanobacteria bacterium P01_H01_bin.130]